MSKEKHFREPTKKIGLLESKILLKEMERIYSDHYEMSHDKAIHDFYNAVQKRIRRYTAWVVVPVVTEYAKLVEIDQFKNRDIDPE